MRWKKIVASSLLLLVCMSIVAFLSSQRQLHEEIIFPLAGSHGENIYLSCELPETPDKILRLQVVEHDVAQVDVERIAEEIFGFTGGSFHDVPEEGCTVLSTPLHILQVYRNGAISYSIDEAPWGVPEENFLSYELVREISENIMGKLEALGQVPGNIQIKYRSIGPSSWLLREENGKEVRYLCTLGAEYDLYFGTLQLYGLGAKVNVNVTADGEIEHFTGFWKDVEAVGEIPITVTPRQALEKLASQGYGSVDAGPGLENVIIKDMMLGYYVGPVFEGENYLQPAYLFNMLFEGRGWSENHIVPISAI